MAYRYLGSGTTDSNGRATLTYTGVGAGEVDIVASLDNPITSDSLKSNVIPVMDGNFADVGLLGNCNDTGWSYSTTNLSRVRGTNGTTLTNNSGASRPYAVNKPETTADLYDWFGSYIVEFDIVEHTGNTVRLYFVDKNGASVYFSLVGISAINNNHVKVVNTGNMFTVYVDGVAQTPVSHNLGRHQITFSLATGSGFTYKNFVIYGMVTDYITVDGTDTIIESGDDVTLTATLYLDSVPGTTEALKFYDGTTLLDTVTAEDGVAEYTYTGTGAGLKEFHVEYGSIQSETYTIFDVLKEYTLTSDFYTISSGSISVSNGVFSVTGSNMPLNPSTSTRYWTTARTFEFDVDTPSTLAVQVGESSNVFSQRLSTLGASAGSHVKIVYDGTTITPVVDGVEKTDYKVSFTHTTQYYFNLYNEGSFKNFVVY